MTSKENKKMVVLLFPEENYVKIQEQFLQEFDERYNVSDVFDTIIRERYKKEGYEFVIVTYKDPKIAGVTEQPDRIVCSTVGQDDFYKNHERMLELYDELAKQLNPEQYSEIVVGGYHVGIEHQDGCVNHLNNAINKISQNSSIDYELTNEFIKYAFIMKNQDYSIELNPNYKYYSNVSDLIDKKSIDKKSQFYT